ALVNNIRYATVLETEKVSVERQAVVLGDFLKQLSSAYENPLNKQLTLSWECPSPLAVVHTDSAKLKHILRNLIDNAFKFTAKGSILAPHA
ncbi:MAG: HAMP domain-containing histidine kinase, partial [Deltaproteobacteria bacterium]|nr:HAMP domain-containing histidine kinase [Deltaproteobacteria bacterium]